MPPTYFLFSQNQTKHTFLTRRHSDMANQSGPHVSGPQGPLPGPLAQLQQHGPLRQQQHGQPEQLHGPPLQQQQPGPPPQQQQRGPPPQQQQHGQHPQQQQHGQHPQQQQHGLHPQQQQHGLHLRRPGQQDQHGLQKQLKHGHLNQLPKVMGSMSPKSTEVRRDTKLQGPFDEEEKTLKTLDPGTSSIT